MRESKIEHELDKAVKAAGGTTRKFVSPGRRGVPDRIVLWPRVVGRTTRYLAADVHFVETKAPKRGPSAQQRREHARLRNLGAVVHVLDTLASVENYVERNK